MGSLLIINTHGTVQGKASQDLEYERMRTSLFTSISMLIPISALSL
jgi:hypothetical protein